METPELRVLREEDAREERTVPAGYARVPRWIIRDPDLSLGAKLVLVAILGHIWRDEDRCRIDVAEVRRDSGEFVQERRLQRLLAELVDRRLIDRFPDPEKPGGAWVTRLLFDPTGGRPPRRENPKRGGVATDTPPLSVRTPPHVLSDHPPMSSATGGGGR